MWAASHHVERDVTSYVSTTAGGAVSRNAPSTVQNRYYCTFSTCEPWAAMLASILTSLPWDSLNRERTSRGKFRASCSAGRRGGKRAEELARKNSNQEWRNALVGVCGNDCACRRPAVF